MDYMKSVCMALFMHNIFCKLAKKSNSYKTILLIDPFNLRT